MATFHFTADQETGQVKHTVTFTYVIDDCQWATTPALLELYWDFGDGSVAVVTSNFSTIKHEYIRPGVYTVSCRGRNFYGAQSTVTESDFITVTPNPNLTRKRMCLRLATEPSEGYGWNEVRGNHQELTFTADAASNVITIAEGHGWITGNAVKVKSDDTLPGNLSHETYYYFIRLSDTTGKLATTYALAIAGTAVDITGAGTGVHTIFDKGIDSWWVEPSGNHGVIPIVDMNDNERMVILDATDGKFWEIDTFDPVSFSGPSYLDKDDDTNGREIDTEDWSREEVAAPDRQYQRIEDQGSHFAIRPQEAGNRGKTGYGATGLRDEQEFSMDAYVNGEKVTPRAKASAFSETADAEFVGAKVEGRRIQYVFKSSASEFQVTCHNHDILIKEEVGSTADRQMGEYTYQREFLDNKVLHITRGPDLLYDRVARETLPGSVTGLTGPDGRDNSGFLSSDRIGLLNAVTASNYSIVAWIKAGTVLYTNTGGAVALTQHSATSNGWMLVYARGATGLPARLELGAGPWFDVRLLSSQISNEALASIYFDVIHNEGRQYLPIF